MDLVFFSACLVSVCQNRHCDFAKSTHRDFAKPSVL